MWYFFALSPDQGLLRYVSVLTRKFLAREQVEVLLAEIAAEQEATGTMAIWAIDGQRVPFVINLPYSHSRQSALRAYQACNHWVDEVAVYDSTTVTTPANI